MLAKFALDDQTYTHISARVPGEKAYYIFPLGFLFEECTPENLLKIDFDGNILENFETHFNQTGYVMHSSIYSMRPDINTICHLHTTAGVAISATSEGLKPISQFAIPFYKKVGYYQYNSLLLNKENESKKILEALGDHNTLFLNNHGTITCGNTIEEAFFYTMFLEKACRTQIAASSISKDLIFLPEEICINTQKKMIAFEQGNIGKRDFEAHCRTTKFPWED